MVSVAAFDTVAITLHAKGVIRFFILLLASLSLVLSPAAAASAPAGNEATQAQCSMAEAEMDMDMGTGGDHDKMDCCTPQCTAPAVAAVLGPNDLGPDIYAEGGSRLLFPRGAMLPSVSPAATDPPPRLPLT